MTYKRISALILIPLTLAFLTACNTPRASISQQMKETASPIEVVERHFEAMRANDMETWRSTMTAEKRQEFSDETFDGLESVTVNEISEITGEIRDNRIKSIL